MTWLSRVDDSNNQQGVSFMARDLGKAFAMIPVIGDHRPDFFVYVVAGGLVSWSCRLLAWFRPWWLWGPIPF